MTDRNVAAMQLDVHHFLRKRGGLLVRTGKLVQPDLYADRLTEMWDVKIHGVITCLVVEYLSTFKTINVYKEVVCPVPGHDIGAQLNAAVD